MRRRYSSGRSASPAASSSAPERIESPVVDQLPGEGEGDRLEEPGLRLGEALGWRHRGGDPPGDQAHLLRRRRGGDRGGGCGGHRPRRVGAGGSPGRARGGPRLGRDSARLRLARRSAGILGAQRATSNAQERGDDRDRDVGARRAAPGMDDDGGPRSSRGRGARRRRGNPPARAADVDRVRAARARVGCSRRDRDLGGRPRPVARVGAARGARQLGRDPLGWSCRRRRPALPRGHRRASPPALARQPALRRGPGPGPRPRRRDGHHRAAGA